MLAVKPVVDPNTSLELCSYCGVTPEVGDFTYFAADVNYDGTKINHIIGVCTFSVKGEKNEITSIAYAPGIEDEEAILIMARAVMNFMYRCHVKSVTAGAGVSEKLARKLGFSEDGRRIDLVEFYKSPCKYSGK